MKKALILLSLVALGGCSYQQIPPGSVGIKFDARTGISEKLLKPELTRVGLSERLIVYPTSIKNASYVRSAREGERKGDDSVKASTVEGATLPVDVTVAWHVDPANVTKAFETFGTEDLEFIQQQFIRYFAIYGTNVVSGKRSIFDLTSKDRALFGPQVKEVIAPILAEYAITVDDVYIGEVYPATEISQKVQERVAARNDLELAKVNLQKAQIDAKTMLTVAERDAELNKLKAQQGEKAIELRKLDILRKALAKWDGEAPLVGSDAVPFTDIKLH